MTIQNWSVLYPRFGDVRYVHKHRHNSSTQSRFIHIFPGSKFRARLIYRIDVCGEVGVGQKISAVETGHDVDMGSFMIDVWFCAGKYF